MKIDKNTIRNIARNARLDEKESEEFIDDLKEILASFSELDKINTKGIEPSIHPIKIENITRKDKIKESFTQEEILSNTKHKKDGFFKGPKSI